MTTLTIQVPDKETELLKQFLKKLNGKIVESKKEPKSPYNPKFVAKVLEGEKARKAGKKGLRVDVNNLWK